MASQMNKRLYDTSSHAFEVQKDTSSHGGRGALAMGVFSIENAPNSNPNLCEFLYVSFLRGFKKRHADRL